ncbi:uncharacterized protein LOC107606873 [Arachis ipaensis]|uniref:uncharacterized protein LOC107606873 n=1 Tax=Arachis ipaensis TaxID=130454 RepID=UPI0007AEF7FA|nr:uncharacterized protein LOC107606873 [Arachis ipaensis]XP_025664554.1 uncharacterized protein LOC112762980 [Arachis hypogaea]
MTLVKWEMIQAPKKLGGLGVGDVVVHNTALLFKWWWRFSKEDCPLWKKIVCSCNRLNSNQLLSTQTLPVRGGPWSDICHLQIKEQQVRQKMIDDLAIEWRRELRQWESETLDQLLHDLQSVRLIAEVQDRVVWKFDKEGVYTTNSFVQVLQEATLDEKILRYKFTKEIWKGLVPPRVELYSWFALIGRINTKDRLSKLGILGPHDNLCVLCKKAVESVHHLLVACEFSWQVWCRWISEFGQEWTAPGTLKDHFESWRSMPIRQEVRKFWLVGFFSVIWNIWLQRNDVIFRNKTVGVVECVTQSFLSAVEWCGN